MDETHVEYNNMGIETGHEETTLAIAENHFAEELSGFTNTIELHPRDNMIRHASHVSYPLKTEVGIGENDQTIDISEREGLLNLRSFLERVASNEELSDGNRVTARDMLENLVFIGQVEMETATNGIAQYFVRYLDEDSNRQICILSEISDDELTKSDTFIADSILGTLSSEDKHKYQGRIITTTAQLNQPAENTKIVLVDDWMLSGDQIETELREVVQQIDAQYAPSFEIVLVASSENQLTNGLAYYNDPWERYDEDSEVAMIVPIKTYYRIPTANTRSHMVTGAHAATDICFETRIGEMVTELRAKTGDDSITMPYLTNIARPYRNLIPKNIAYFSTSP